MHEDGVAAVREYHELTKLYPGASTGSRRVEAALMPRQSKRYTGVELLPLPPPSLSGRSLFEVMPHSSNTPGPLHLKDLAAVLHYAAGIVRRGQLAGRDLEFRAASCTGALYHIELYVVCGDLDSSIPAGLYHYDVPSGGLRKLRQGDYRRALAAACCDDAIAGSAASVILTSTFWRNAWRYEERAYRHVFWDGGTLLANLISVAKSHSLRPILDTAFVDAELNALLSVDPRREAAIAVVSLAAAPAAPSMPEVPALTIATEPLSRVEIEYPLIWQTQAATVLETCEAVEAWRGSAMAARETGAPTPPVHAARRTLEESIEHRGSARRFSQAPLERDAFEAILGAAPGGLRSDAPLAGKLIRPLLIVNRVTGLESGAYGIGPDGRPSLLSAGNFAGEAEHLGLDQAAASSAAVNLYFVADLDEVTSALGGRGYRAVQIEAGIRTGQVYLAASALGLRASGLTFYDDEVAKFFGQDPDTTLVLMLVVFGA